MFGKKKLIDTILKLSNEIDSLKKKLKYVSPEEMTPEVIELDAKLKASNAKMSIGNGNKDENLYNVIKSYDSIYSQIQNNQLPSDYAWVFYKTIMNIGLIWLNRYTKFTTKKHNKKAIVDAMFACILYGTSCYDVKDRCAYYVSFENDEIKGCPINNIYQKDFFTYDKGWHVNVKYKMKKLNKDNVVLFEWQMGQIGIFVWYMQDVLNYLVMKDILLLNINASSISLVYEIKDIEAFKQQWYFLMNPRQFIKPMIVDEINGVNRLSNVSPEIVARCETIMSVLRFAKEEMYNEWGIKITSAKSQSLSSDANLSASVSKTIAWEHDRRMIDSMKELGINLKINEEDIIIPQNDNADKNGEGMTNTERYLNERKSK